MKICTKTLLIPLISALLCLSACTATTASPPFSSRGSTARQRTFGSVQLSSGRFARPHRVIGVIQMTQTGYKWFHEIEVVDDARPESLLFKIGRYASQYGADGIQHLSLTDLDPQTPAPSQILGLGLGRGDRPRKGDHRRRHRAPRASAQTANSRTLPGVGA